MAVSNPAKFSSLQTEAASSDNYFSHYNRGGSIISSAWPAGISTTANGLALSQFNGAVRPTRTTSWSTAVTTSYTTTWSTMEWTFGCVVSGTRILLPDGNFKLIDAVRPFDKLASVMVPGLQPETVEDYVDYQSDTFDGAERAITEAKSIYGQQVNVLFEIRVRGYERTLKVTPEHPFLIQDEHGIYRFCTADELNLGHRLINRDLMTVQMESIELLSGDFLIFKLDCAPYDLFIHEDIVGHNLKPGDTNPMDHQTLVTLSKTTTRATTRTTSVTTNI